LEQLLDKTPTVMMSSSPGSAAVAQQQQEGGESKAWQQQVTLLPINQHLLSWQLHYQLQCTGPPRLHPRQQRQ
jgi:hypothetical protein